MSEDKDPKCACADELVVGPEMGDGTRPFVRHTADHRLLGGFMRSAKDGQACNGCEVVALTPLDGSRYKVETLYDGSAAKGPSKVSTREYRSGCERTFGRKGAGQA
jgi:hypothetical protein